MARTKLLFVAWGYSIHARRRIQVFVDDPRFDVAVVSNHDYQFQGAQNHLVSQPGTPPWRYLWTALGLTKLRLQRWTFADLLLNGLFAARDLRRLREVVAEFAPDVVFLQTLLYPCYLALALPRALPIMITFWNGDVTWWAQYDRIERQFKRQLVGYGARRAQAITVNSEAARKACLDYGAAPANVHLIRYPGVDLARFGPGSRAAARAQLGLGDGPLVLAPRGLGGYLNSDVILAAVAELAPRRRDLVVLFAGVTSDEELARHQKLAAQLGISAHCRWEGRVDWEAMPAYYQAADVMVSMSSKDSLPNCMLEAMACGCALVMGDIAPIREWVRDGHNGYLVDCRDARALAQRLDEIFSDQAPLQQFAERNHERVRAEADGRKNNEILKALVDRVAGRVAGHVAGRVA